MNWKCKYKEKNLETSDSYKIWSTHPRFEQSKDGFAKIANSRNPLPEYIIYEEQKEFALKYSQI